VNGGREESHGKQIIPLSVFQTSFPPREKGAEEFLKYDEVYENFKIALSEVARVYAKTMYCIHYMHDKYYYERAQMAFVDSDYGVDIAYGLA
jgi:formate C-acetyltransferase